MKRVGETIVFSPKTLAIYTISIMGLGGGGFTMAREIAVTPANGYQVDQVEVRLGKMENTMNNVLYQLCEIRNDRLSDQGKPVRNCGNLPQ